MYEKYKLENGTIEKKAIGDVFQGILREYYFATP